MVIFLILDQHAENLFYEHYISKGGKENVRKQYSDTTNSFLHVYLKSCS